VAHKSRERADESPAGAIESLALLAIRVARTAQRNNASLAGDNFYGNKLARLRADAAGAFKELPPQSGGDTTALAELIDAVFATTTPRRDRLKAFRDLQVALSTTWKTPAAAAEARSEPSVFPLVILERTKRAYLISLCRQMNGCYSDGWYDACAVMMRRLVEISIIEAFEAKGLADAIKGADGNYFQLSDLVSAALGQPKLNLSRNAKKELPKLRDVGHRSAHGRYFNAEKDDIERVQSGCRVVIEEFLHHAGLLT
jgi:hypothetical protein